ncbi:MAG: sulfatase-like hydrolase/transferase, partial [Verrucomicrobiota bacterium]|nr:sulfatase-like hydrolase/transferase [Verrucomicrobiota bacterium]
KVLGLDPDDPISIIGPKEPGGAPYGKSIGGKKAHEARPEHRIDLMVTHQAKKWIEENSEQPFFVNVALVAPHVPLSPGREFRGKSELGVYGDFVEQMDWCVGQIFQTLEECGVADNTIVMFTSDNGAVVHREPIQHGHRSNRDWLGQKTDAWEGGVRVPFIVRWPGTVEAGTTSDALFSLADICKTVWDAVDVKPENNTALNSVSQLPVWTGAKESVRAEMMHLGIFGYALRSGAWVYVPYQGSGGVTTKFEMPGWLRLPGIGQANSDIDETGHLNADAPDAQLYNLKTDPSQTRNVIGEHPEKAAEMTACFKALHKQMTDEYERNLK